MASSSSSSFTLITLFSLALVASIIEARVSPGESNNWEAVAKDESLAEGTEHFIHGESTSSASLSGEKNDCHTSNNNHEQNQKDQAKLKGQTRRTFMKGFEPRPIPLFFADEDDDAGLKAEKEFIRDFEPRPNLPIYHG